MKTLQALGLLLAAASAPLIAADFSYEAGGGAPPEGAPAAVAPLVSSEAVTVKGPGGAAVARFWGRTAEFEGEASGGFGIRYDFIPEGAVIALVEFPEEGSDFREQNIPAGLYTLRYALHPEDGNHMGVAPSRDFSVLTPASGDDADPNSLDFAGLVTLTRKVGNPHPTVVRLELPEGSEGPNLWEDDYEHWVLDLPVAGDVVGIVVYGHSEE